MAKKVQIQQAARERHVEAAALVEELRKDEQYRDVDERTQVPREAVNVAVKALQQREQGAAATSRPAEGRAVSDSPRPPTGDSAASVRAAVEDQLRVLESRMVDLQRRFVDAESLSSAERLGSVVADQVQRHLAEIRESVQQSFAEQMRLLGEVVEDIDAASAAYRKLAHSMPVGGMAVLEQRAQSLQAQLDDAQQRELLARETESKLRVDVAHLQRETLLLKQQDNRVLLEDVLKREQAVAGREAELQRVDQWKDQNERLAAEVQAARTAQRADEETHRLAAERQKYFEESTAARRALQDAQAEASFHHSQFIRVSDRERHARGTIQQLTEKSEADREALARAEEVVTQRAALREERDALHDAWCAQIQRADLCEADMRALTQRLQQAREAEARATENARREMVEQLRERAEQMRGDALAQAHVEHSAEMSKLQRALQITQDDLTHIEAAWADVRAERDDLLAGREQHERDLRAEREQHYLEAHAKRDELLQAAARDCEGLVLEAHTRAVVLKGEVSDLERREEALKSRVAQAESERQVALERSNSLRADVAKLDVDRHALKSEIERLQQREKELRHIDLPRDERLRDLARPALERPRPLVYEHEDEAEWLSMIEAKIAEANFRFSPRLLRAFHTSLKTSSIAPITILSGISGTGKSELPRLYSDLGGLEFLNVAVQPNWDSPEDLFGFFNYTDGRYRARPLARLLAQANHFGEVPSLEKHMCVVLLDEMNIARIEYYFSELLSKLETRRGLTRGCDGFERGSVEIDAGAGKEAAHLFLDHNVLFVGTMNEDESTLSLSDKVKDRAQFLTFPAPRVFQTRSQALVTRRDTALPRATWERWTTPEAARRGSLQDALNGDCREINEALGGVGRAIGHRVFQAMLDYLVQYPQGPNSDDDARADVFAMKVIPKLQGIETRSRAGKTCLDGLRQVLPSSLHEAFGRAREGDFFAWQGLRDAVGDDGARV